MLIGKKDGRKEKKMKKRKRKKSFGIYWEGADTFDLKVPRVGFGLCLFFFP